VGADAPPIFCLRDATAGQRSWRISENTLVTMYMNNRAVETLAASQIDDALW